MEHGPVLGQIYVQLSYAAMYLLSRVVLHQGMSHYLYVFFRQCVACIAITVIVLFIESGRSAKPSLRDLGKIFVLAILGITVSQNLYFAGLSLTSTTLATTMYCMYPAITFIFTLVFRMEKLELSELRGRAKLLGTLLCVGGAVFMTLFKGPVIFGYHSSQHEGLSLSVDSSWILGGLLLAGGVCTWSSCFIYQAWITLDCTSQLTTTAVMCWMGALQSGLLALLFVQTPDAWRLGWDLQLLTITYSGVFCSAIGLFVILWCVEKKGPLFTSVFSPLCNVIVAIFEPILLHVPFCWGGIFSNIIYGSFEMGLIFIGIFGFQSGGHDSGDRGSLHRGMGENGGRERGGVGEVVVSGNTTDCDYSEPLLISGGDEAVKV